MFSVAFPFIMISRHYWTLASFYLSRADVASSNRRIVGSSSIALAIATLCFVHLKDENPEGQLSDQRNVLPHYHPRIPRFLLA